MSTVIPPLPFCAYCGPRILVTGVSANVIGGKKKDVHYTNTYLDQARHADKTVQLHYFHHSPLIDLQYQTMSTMKIGHDCSKEKKMEKKTKSQTSNVIGGSIGSNGGGTP